MQSYVGSFTKTTAAATASQSVTGVGFQPKALLIWMSNLTAEATITSAFQHCQGIVTATEAYCVANAINSGGTAGAVSHANKVLRLINTSSTVQCECVLTSFDSDGFTLSWTTNNASAYLIGFIALGGSDLTNAKIVDWTTGTSTGSKAVTGVGFQPDFVYHLSAGLPGALPTSDSTQCVLATGAMTSATQTMSSTFFYEASGATSTFYSASKCFGAASLTGFPSPTTPAIDGYASYTSMDSDGFTINIGNAFGASYHVTSLCLKGGSYYTGSFSKTTSAATASQSVTGVGFKPSCVLHQGPPTTTADTTAASGFFHHVGLQGPGGQEWAMMFNSTKIDTVSTKSWLRHASSAVQAEADNVSMDSDGFTLSFTTNNATAYTSLFIAFGPGVVPADLTFGSVAGVATVSNIALRTKPHLALSSAAGVATASAPVKSRSFLGLSQVAGLATASALVKSPAILSLSASGLAGPTVLLQSPAILGLSQVNGVAVPTLAIVDKILQLSQVDGVATASALVYSKSILDLSAAAGVASDSLALGSKTIMVMSAAGLATAASTLTTPALLVMTADGVAVVTGSVSSIAYFTMTADGLADLSMALSIWFRTRVAMGGGSVVITKENGGFVVRETKNNGAFVTPKKLPSGFSVRSNKQQGAVVVGGKIGAGIVS